VSVKRLIVNADDLGRDAGVNRGVFEAHERGIVTSASLMVNGPAAPDAAAQARENPRLGIGLHLALTGAVPVLAREHVASIVDTEGRLPATPAGLARARPSEVLGEARAQVRRFRELMGRAPTHLDTHHHSHRENPAVLEAVVTLSWELGVPIRNASVEVGDAAAREGLPTSDHFVEAFSGEQASLEGLIAILFGLSLGTTELVCHPAGGGEEPGGAGTRAAQLAALIHRETRQAIQAAGVRLINWSEL
jgi:predicted glycoside hydrolase/deacetylase ChbG (UPF0249 family)